MRKGILLIMLFFLIGCSSKMSVQVDIFDPKGLDANDTLQASVNREAALHVYLLNGGFYAKTKANLKDQMRDYLEFLAQPKIAIVSHVDIEKLFGKAANTIDSAVGNAVEKRNRGLEKTRVAASIEDDKKKKIAFESALELFSSATQELTDLRSKVKKPYDGLLKKHLEQLHMQKEPDLEMINKISFNINDTDAVFEKNVRSLTGGLDLFDDPLASYVISAPDKYWQGIYNKAQASGTIGNTDIAIKMETVGTFTIKGLRLDASKVTEASFEILKQSVRMVAAAYGVPVPGGKHSSEIQPPGQPNATSPTNVILNVDQLKQSAERKRQLSRIAALSLLDIIIVERNNLLSEDGLKRQRAISRVKQSFEAYKSQLKGE